MFVDLLRRGATVKEAGRITRRALYDWGDEITDWELRTIAKVSPFWRFFRAAHKQTLNAFLDPHINYDAFAPVGKSGKARARTGTVLDYILPTTGNRIMNLRAQGLLLGPRTRTDVEGEKPKLTAREGILAAGAEQNPRATVAQAQEAAFVLANTPGYVRDRTKTDIEVYDYLQTQTLYNRTGGRLYTHSVSVRPQLTNLDMLNIESSILQGMLGVGLQVAGAEQFLSSNWEEAFFKPTLDMLGPGFKGMATSMAERLGGETGQFHSVNLTPSQAAFVTMFGGAVNLDDRGRYRADSDLVKPILDGTPILMSTFPIVDAAYYKNPETTLGAMAYRFGQHYSGMSKKINMNPDQQATFHAMSTMSELKEMMEDTPSTYFEPMPDRE